MSRLAIIAACLALGACATDGYAPTTGAADHIPADLAACKRQAIHDYFHGQNQVAILIGGGLGGALGGAIAGSVSTHGPSAAELTETCMRQRGYEGWSK